MKHLCLSLTAAALLLSQAAASAQEVKPLKALLIVGGCCHDYTKQKTIIAEAVSKRAQVEWTIVHQGGTATDSKIPYYEKADWADGFDIVVHNECFSNIPDPAWTQRVLKPHQDGLPGVVIHCAMHCYRDKTDEWFKFCGVTSHRHGGHFAFDVKNLAPDNPIMKGFGESWKTPKGELYHIAKLWETATPLGQGYSPETKSDHVCIWTNLYGEKKTRVFGTTVGHYNEEMQDPVFQEYLTRGILWACGKLDDPKYLTPMKEVKITEIGTDGKQTSTAKPILKPGTKIQVPENLAAGKKTSSDGDQDAERDSAKAVDGKLETRWSPVNGNTGHWWQVDLGKEEEVTGAKLVWEFDGRTYKYVVEGSADDKSWTMLSDQQNRSDKDQEHDLKFQAKTRYVRVKVTGLDPGAWGSLWEVEVYGTKMIEKLVTAGVGRLESVKGDPALKGIKLPPGFKATLFAGPPHVNYPTVVSSTPDGVLYVGVDENGSLGQDRKRAQKVVRCEDTDGDGKADKFTDFVPRVESPRGLVADGKTLFVLHPPFVRAYHDDNADGVADRDEVLVEGLGFDLKFRGADHTTNGMRLGIDGWLYIAVGDYGAVAAKGKDGSTLQLHGGGVVRVRTDGSELELVARGLRNIYDVAVDSRLNLFTRDNTNDGGGWNVRLSHIIGGGAEYGYPSLFKNFPDEIVQPLADYGGGSPTGILAVDEPGLPPEIGQTLLTCDWGRSIVYRHPLTPKGASFTAEQHEFIQIPRPTDIDVDALGRFYISSWGEGGFSYSKPDIGYVIRVTYDGPDASKGPVLDYAKATDGQLLEELASASHTRRLAAQREMLRRGIKETYSNKLKQLVKTQPQAVAVAAINTLNQIEGNKCHEFLTGAASSDDVAEYCIRALADRKSAKTALSDVELFMTLSSKNEMKRRPRLELATTQYLARLGSADHVRGNIVLADNDDPVIAHAAIKSLSQVGTAHECLKWIDENPDASRGILLALQTVHEPKVVDGLIARLPKATNSDLQQGIFRALCRLYYREAEWKGEWWGTRPDTSGPYFKPVTWEESENIKQALTNTLAAADKQTLERLLPELVRHKIEIDEASERLVSLTKSEPTFRTRGLELILSQSKLHSSAAPVLAEAALANDLPVELRAKCAAGLLKGDAGWQAAENVFATLGSLDSVAVGVPPALEAACDVYLRQAHHRQNIEHWIELSKKSDEPNLASLALAVLLEIDTSDNKSAGAAARKHLEALWKTPRASTLLIAIGNYRLDAFAYQVSQRLNSDEPSVRSAAAFAAKRLQLDDPRDIDPSKLIAKLGYEQTLEDASKEKGDANRGKLLFRRQGCVACHTTSKNESLKGPYLGDIANRYKRPELIESIVKPSAKIAQGFVTHGFLTSEGQQIEGFVVRESGDEVELRTQTGASVLLKTDDIEQRKKRDISIMPQGLVDKLTPSDLASLVAYLESLKGK
jgi:putative heme-binding domain-containing protein